MSQYLPYTYLIGWSKLNKWYYGSRYAKGCHPSDLWVKYFTSSKYVKQFRKEFGEPDVIEIRKTFQLREKAVLWEHKVLSRMGVIYSDKWINKSNGNVFNNGNEDTKQKHKESLKKHSRQFSVNGEIFYFTTDCARKYNIDHTSVMNRLKNRSPKFIEWYYLDEGRQEPLKFPKRKSPKNKIIFTEERKRNIGKALKNRKIKKSSIEKMLDTKRKQSKLFCIYDKSYEFLTDASIDFGLTTNAIKNRLNSNNSKFIDWYYLDAV